MVRKCKLEFKENNVVTVTNNNVKYYENLARQHSESSKEYAIKSEENSKSALLLANSHIENNKNPHDVTAEQVGAFSKAEIQEILEREFSKKNPNLVEGTNISIEDNEDGTQTIGFSDTVSIDYEILENRPSINNVSLVGNKTSSDLGLASIEEVPIKVSELQNDSGYLTQHQDISYLATKSELVEGLSQKQNELSIAQVLAANSGITSELVSKIEDVNNGLLTIQKDGETIGIFSANSSENKVVNIESSNLENACDIDLSNLSDNGKKVIDGEWVYKKQVLSTALSTGSYGIDLSEYLPDDNYTYEVLLNGVARSNTTWTGSTIETTIYISSDFYVDEFITNRVHPNGVNDINTYPLVVTHNRSFTLRISGHAAHTAKFTALAYRRIGTNS